MRNSLVNHLNHLGADGLYTFNAGLTVEEGAKIGPHNVKRSALHEFQIGDEVVIRGCPVVCKVKKVLGACMILAWPGNDWRTFYRQPAAQKGAYEYGDVVIHRGHVDLLEWRNDTQSAAQSSEPLG